MFPSYTPSGWRTRRVLALEALEDRTNPAPPLLQTIPGITFDEDGANNGGGFSVPPDPNGAAGPTHVVSIVNTSIEFHRISDSAQQVSESLDTFFAPLSPTALLFDPKVVYDQFENRFVVVCLEQSDTPQISRVLLAVSDDSDPNGTWRFVAINSRLTISGGNAWADYPGFAVDEEAVYVTANMFQFSGASVGVRLWIIAKGTTNGWYAGGTPAVSAALNPYPSGSPVTSMPAQIYGTPPAGATGTFLVGYDGISNGTNESVKITRIDNPLGTPSFATQLVSVGDIDNTAAAIPGAPQSGTATTIDTGDRRVLNAVWRNNQLYFAATVDPGSGPNAGQATAHWFDVNTTNPGSLTLTDQGNIGGEDIAAGTYTFYPNVAVDAGGNLGIGFAASGPGIFPGAYYTGRKASDAAGTVQATGTLQAGVAFYVREFSAGENRWGDYSGLALAPDGWTFWAFNEYAMTQGTPDIGTGNGRWATEWGRFTFNTPPRVTSPIPDVTVNEDAAPTTTDLNPFFEDTEDPDSALVYSVVGNTNPGLVATSFPTANNLRLTYTPDGNGMALITVRAADTAGGTVDSQFLVTVNPVNDAPVLDNSGNMALADILEDPATNPGTLILDIIASAGGDRITDVDTGAQEGIAVTAADTANGSWEFSTDGGSTWTALGAVSATSARLLASDAATRVRFVPAANFNGTLATALTFRAWDRTTGANGGTADPSANGGTTAFSTATETASLNVLSVNDAPAFTKGANQTVNEDAGAQSVTGWATGMSPGPPNESGQALTFLVSTDNDSLFSALPAISPTTGTLTFTPAANAFGSATVTVRLKDDGGTANGGVDTSAPQTFTITVNPVNDAPSFTKGPDQTVNEDAGAQTVVNWAANIVAGPPNESGQTLSFEVSTNNDPLFSVLPAVSPAGTLTYTPAADAFGSATVTVRLHDNGGTANGGVDVSPPQTFTITVNGVNVAPTFNKGSDQTVNEDAGAQSVAGWATNISPGPPNESGQTLTFTTTTNNDALFSALPAVNPTTGTLTYTPAPNAFGTATVTVVLHDNGGTANGGVDTSAPQTFTITVNSVNDAPSFAKGADQTVNEDAGPQGVNGWATGISAGPPNEGNQALTFEVTNNTNPGLFSAGPTVTAAGALTYTPAPDANGSATITLRLRDDGGTANGGVDVSPTQTFTITVNSVNDAPSFTKGTDQTVNEDAGAQSVANWATAISPGPANESGQALTFDVTTNNNALFSALPAISPAGTLTYTPAANANGLAAVTVRLRDNGGTANGGVDTSPPQTFTITVNSVNDAPSFTKGADQVVNEDAGAQTVTGWATAISPGPANESAQAVTFEVVNDTNPGLFASLPAVSPAGALTYTPAADAFGSATITIRLRDDGGTANGGVDVSPTQTFTITVNSVNDAPTFTPGGNQTVNEDAGAQTVTGWATNLSAGPANESGQTLSFDVSSTNPGLFAALPAISPAGTLTYTPAVDAFGSATVTVRLRDNGGTANGGVDVSPPETFTITVNSVNDAPTFTKGPNPTVLEDAGPQTVAGWATGISAGSPNESGQALSFEIASDSNPGLFAAGPAISPSGTLTYTPAADANGSATIQVRLHDDGGTSNGGQDTSALQTFTISITPVNDAPTFAKGADQTVDENSGAQTVAGWATAISPGPADEAGQTLTFDVVTNNNALFAVLPAVNPATGTLTYTPAAHAAGAATVTVRLRDNGGTANGGADTSPPQSFTITVNPVNEPPVANPDAASTTDQQPITVDVLANDTDPDGDPLTLVSVTGATKGTATVVGNQVRYVPRPNAHGDDVLTYTVRDSIGATATATLTVHVTDVTAPTVKEVRLYYGNGRYELLTDRVPILGWSNIRQVQLVFSENVSVQQNDLTVAGVNVASYAFSAFAYNASTFTATWTLAAPIGIDRVRLALDGTSPNGVKDTTAGNLIGSDVTRLFAVLPGDLDGDGIVTLLEANTVKKNIGKRYPNPKTADVNGDGLVTRADYLIVKANIGKRI